MYRSRALFRRLTLTPTNMKKTLIWALLILAFFPIGWLGNVPYPSVAGKTILLRGVITFALCIIAWLSYVDTTYRAELLSSLRRFWKTPIAKVMAISYAGLVVSTMGAFDHFIAFYGNAERSEGFLGLSFFYALFVLLAVVFTRREWNRFFIFSLWSGWIVFLIEVGQALSGMSRPASTIDNPLYLAGYLLFVGFIGAHLWMRGVREKNTGYVRWGIASVVMALVGIFITQSRGAIAGLVISSVVTLVYLAVKGRSVGLSRWNVRSLAVGILATMVLSAGLFLATIHSPVWQYVPGVNRIADFSFKDGSTRARLTNASISLAAVNPKNEGVGRLLFGWGWDNYIYAWQAHYVPHLYAYDTARFDHPHNKLFDMLTMTGVIGLLAYLALWAVLVRKMIARGREYMWEGAALLAWATAFFMQNLTGFDTLGTFFTFFVMVAYCVSDTDMKKSDTVRGESPTLAVPMVTMGLALISLWIFFVGTMMPYFQMFAYRAAIEYSPSINDASLLGTFPFAYDTYVRGLICNDLINTVFKSYNDGSVTKGTPFLDRAIVEMESYLHLHPDLYDDHLVLAKAYDVQSAIQSNSMLYLQEAEVQYKAALALMPERQTILYPYAINLAQQGRAPEAIAILEKTFAQNPDIHDTQYIIAEVYAIGGKQYDMQAMDAFERSFAFGINLNPKFTIKAYQSIMKDYYEAGDRKHFIQALERLSTIAIEDKSAYQAILKDTKESGSMPQVDFTGF